MEKESESEDSSGRRGFVRKLVGVVAASGLAGLLLGRSPQPASGAMLPPPVQTLFASSSIQTLHATGTQPPPETSIIGPGLGSMTLPANYFSKGKTLRISIRASTYYANVPLVFMTLRFKLGTTLVAASRLPLPGGEKNWEVVSDEVIITCLTNGPKATVIAQAQQETLVYVVSGGETPMGVTHETAAPNPIKIDTTQPITIDVTAGIEYPLGNLVLNGTTVTVASTNVVLEALT